MKWYYQPDLGTSLSNGLDNFIKHDDTVDEHLDSLLKTIASHEQTTGEPIDAHIITWRGMLTKVCLSSPKVCGPPLLTADRSWPHPMTIHRETNWTPLMLKNVVLSPPRPLVQI